MRSIPIAMTWEMLRRGRWYLFFGILGAYMIPIILIRSLIFDGVEPQDPSLLTIHLVVTQINMLMIGASIFASLGSPSRLSFYPIPTTTIVTWHMIPAMVFAASEMVIRTAFLNWLLDQHWPLWGPALFVAVGVFSIKAMMWLTDKSGWLILTVIPLVILLEIWFKSRFGPVFSEPERLWLEVTPGEVATLASVAVASYFVAIKGVSRSRCGEFAQPLGIVAWVERILSSELDDRRRFRTPAEAQAWFVWQRKGWVMPILVAFGLSMGICAWLIFSRQPRDLLDGFYAAGAMLSLLVAIFGGIIIGATGSRDGDQNLGHFLSTRPMTTNQMAMIILKLAAKSVLIAWLIWAITFSIIYGAISRIQGGNLLSPDLPLEWWYMPATLLGCWTVMTVIASTCLTGQAKHLALLFGGLAASCIGFGILGSFTSGHEMEVLVSYVETIAIGVVLVMGTGWTFETARRRQLIGPTTMVICGLCWLLMAGVIIFEWIRHPRAAAPGFILLMGATSLVVAPFAAAPIALSWNRVR